LFLPVWWGAEAPRVALNFFNTAIEVHKVHLEWYVSDVANARVVCASSACDLDCVAAEHIVAILGVLNHSRVNDNALDELVGAIRHWLEVICADC
jgi:hypothetical protein